MWNGFSFLSFFQDAAWLLPSSQPLRCTSPADVYMLLKSSDFVLHDLSAESVFEGCIDIDNKKGNDDGDDKEVEGEALTRDDDDGGGGEQVKKTKTKKDEYALELVLRKWFAIDPSREMRAFVRDGVLVGEFSPLPPSCSAFLNCVGLFLFLFFYIFVSPCFTIAATVTQPPPHTHACGRGGRYLAAG